MYAFLFDKRSLSLFLWGLAFIGAVLFLAGTLFGVHIELPPSPPGTRAPLAFEPLSSSAVPVDVRAAPAPAAEPAGVPAEPPSGREPARAGSAEQAAPRVSVPVADPPATAPAGRDRGIALSLATEIAPGPAIDIAPRAADIAPQAADGSDATAAGTDIGTSAGAAVPAPAAPAGYVVQVGAFSSQKNAAAMARAMRGKGYDVSIDAVFVDGQALQAVRLGPYADAGSARAAADALRRDDGIRALVRKAGTPR